MPVSKKRKKKDGKPVHRTEPVAPATEHAHGPEGHPVVEAPVKVGRPSNPFVAQRPSVRGAQRGR